MKHNYRALSIQLIEERIYLIEFNSEELQVDDVVQLFNVLEEMGKGDKVGVMAVFDRYHTPSDEVMKHLHRDGRSQQVIYASAIIIESLPIRLLIMLFMNFYNRSAHRKVFNNRNNALKWLREKRDNTRKKQFSSMRSTLKHLLFP